MYMLGLVQALVALVKYRFPSVYAYTHYHYVMELTSLNSQSLPRYTQGLSIQPRK